MRIVVSGQKGSAMEIDVAINLEAVREVWSVHDFCKRYRLDETEEKRLKALFGDYATQVELLTNARRRPIFR